MLQVVCSFVIFLAIVGSGESSTKKLPPFVIPCSQNDPEFNKCFVDHGNDVIPKLKNGDKKYRILPIYPLRINEAVLNTGGNLKLVMRNIDAYGLEEVKIMSSDTNLNDGIIKLTANVNHVQLIGDYKIEGKILILPITGNGKANITFEDVNLTYELHFNGKEKDGVKLFNVKENKCKVEPKRLYFDLENLFNGDERLSSEMRKFMNENWSVLYEELRGSFEPILASVIKNFVEQVIKDVPIDDIFKP